MKQRKQKEVLMNKTFNSVPQGGKLGHPRAGLRSILSTEPEVARIPLSGPERGSEGAERGGGGGKGGAGHTAIQRFNEANARPGKRGENHATMHRNPQTLQTGNKLSHRQKPQRARYLQSPPPIKGSL